MATALRVLIVDPSSDNALTLARQLERGGYKPTLQRVCSLTDFEAALQAHPWDVVLCHTELADFSVERVLDVLRVRTEEIPCLVVTSESDDTSAVSLMAAGAKDFIRYEDLSRLCAAVTREMSEVSVRLDRQMTRASLDHHTRFDTLTNLPNRTTFLDRLTLALVQAARHRKMLAIVYVDLDRFKNIVDTLGHHVGDQILKEVAQRISGCLVDGDTVARLGGDEFVILLTDIDRADRAVQVAQRIIEVLQTAFKSGGHELHITTSIGISLYPYDGEDGGALMKNADTALYRAKEQGRNNYQLYTPAMNARAFERLAMENSLRKALERKQFLIHYQPQIDLKTGMIVGVEALLRWQHPDLGLVYPSEFIGMAEETGLIVPLGAWVLRTACEQSKAWQESGFPPITMAVNLSGRQFQDHTLMETITRIIHEVDIEPQRLELEITESIAMQHADYSHIMLRDLKSRGVKIALDDFCTGYSSLSYLKKFPIDTLKIDQSFVRDLTTDANDAAIANAVIVLAHSLHLSVVAEGVETEAQARFLREHGCDRWQGYLFTQPLASPLFEALWQKQLKKAS